MKTTKLFFMAALALTIVACSNDDNDFENPAQQPAEAQGIPFTATISMGGDKATTRALSENGSGLTVTWTVDEEVALIHKGIIDMVKVASVDGNVATISGTITTDDDGAEVTVIFPYSAVDLVTKDVKANLLYTQSNGTLADVAAKYDVRKGTGSLKVSGTASLDDDVELDNQFAIFKFTTKNSDGSATIDVKPLTVTTGGQDYVITPASATSTLYAALPPISSQEVTFTATGSDSKTYTASKASVTFAAGMYYQSNIKLAEQAPSYTMAAAATSDDKGKLICTEGHIHANGEDAECTAARVAMIVYVGSDNGEEAPYNHGLALALSDANGGNTCKWKTSNTDAGHTYKTEEDNFTSESGLQYNAMHSSEIDNYPAFKAAIANNGTAAPTGCSAWFLASGYQWTKMIDACKNVLGTQNNCQDLRTGFSSVGGSNLQEDYYWSSTEFASGAAWDYGFFGNGGWGVDNKNGGWIRVRACLAF